MVYATQFSEPLKIKLKPKVGVTLYAINYIYIHQPIVLIGGSFNFSLFCNSLICAVVVSYL